MAPRPIPLQRQREVDAGAAHFLLRYQPEDDGAAQAVAAILPAAAARLDRWGAFGGTVTILVLPSHAALEEAVYRQGYPWLRAWARYDTIHLQSPRTWGGTPAQILELLTHELTHCLMYQRSAGPWSWELKDYPLWFREGMASVTSGQGYRRMTEAQLAAWFRGASRIDPLLDADELYQSEPEIVYSSAHRAFELLLRRFGDGAVRAMLDDMKRGAGFDEAFARATRMSPRAFAHEFRETLRPGRQ